MEHLNKQIFLSIQASAGNSIVLDTIAIIFSQYLLWILLLLVLLIPLSIFFFKENISTRLHALKIFFLYALTLLFTYSSTEIIKGVVRAPRPAQLLPNVVAFLPYGSFDSFPSMHAALAFALAVATFFWSRTIGYGLLVLAGLIALSRIYVGVHFPLDVLVGSLLGAGISVLIISLFNTYFKK